MSKFNEVIGWMEQKVEESNDKVFFSFMQRDHSTCIRREGWFIEERTFNTNEDLIGFIKSNFKHEVVENVGIFCYINKKNMAKITESFLKIQSEQSKHLNV